MVNTDVECDRAWRGGANLCPAPWSECVSIREAAARAGGPDQGVTPSNVHFSTPRHKTGTVVLVAWLVLALAAASAARADTVRFRLEGVEGALANNIRAYVGDLPEIETRREARLFAERAEQRAELALEALGYYRASIRSELDRDGDSGAWTLLLLVSPGDPVRLRDVDVRVEGEGGDDRAFRDLIARLPLQEGRVLNHSEYESTRNALRRLALDRGYFDHTMVRHQVQVNSREGWADVALVLDSGRRYSLGAVRFPEAPLEEALLARLVPFEPGTPYDASLVADLNANLYESGYFDSVRVLTQQEEAVDGDVPVDAEVIVREPNTLGFGLGFSTDEGPRVRTSWDRHWHNRRGHKIFSEARASAVRQNVTSRYVIPLRDPLNDRIEIQGGVQHESLRDTSSRRATFGVQRQQEFGSGWRRTQSVRVLHERFRQGGDRANTTLLLPGLGFNRTRSRGGIDPYWGDHQSYLVEVADDRLLSDVSVARATLTGKLLRRPFERHRLIFRAETGGIATNDFSRVPSSLRFFTGGDQTVRGYPYQGLAPRDDDGDLIGGRYMVAGSAEYNYEFRPNWRAAVFVDAGNAFSEPDDFEAKIGSGFGVRWISPVGPIRFDLAWGVSESDTPFRLHISMGPPF